MTATVMDLTREIPNIRAFALRVWNDATTKPGAAGGQLAGTKTWTSGAHRAHQIVVLARTAAIDLQHRHAGFSQFLVPCDAAGMTINSIELMSGEHHFNEVIR